MPQPPTSGPNETQEPPQIQHTPQQRVIDPAAPLSRNDVFNGLSDKNQREAEELEASVLRRASDLDLVNLLRTNNFEGPDYKYFENELGRYGLSVMRGWLSTGHIFKLIARQRRPLNPTARELESLAFESDMRDDLAVGTTAVTLPWFRKHALIEGGWNYEGGASIPTYFMGACVLQFPNELKRHRSARRDWTRADLAHVQYDLERGHADDPGPLVVSGLQVLDDINRLGRRQQHLVLAMLDGYTHARNRRNVRRRICPSRRRCDLPVARKREDATTAKRGHHMSGNTQRPHHDTAPSDGGTIDASPLLQELVEASSLGTDGARQLRHRADNSVALHMEWTHWQTLLSAPPPGEVNTHLLQSVLAFASKCERSQQHQLATAAYSLAAAQLISRAADNLHQLGRADDAATWRARANTLANESTQYRGTRNHNDPATRRDASNRHHVTPNTAGGWDVTTPAAHRATTHADTQEEAIQKARELLRNAGGGQLTIYNPDQSIQSVETVPSKDRHPPQNAR